jgi:hypothetical protein
MATDAFKMIGWLVRFGEARSLEEERRPLPVFFVFINARFL